MGYLGSKPANTVVTSEQIADGTITAADLSQDAKSVGIFRNRIINGDMRIDQRNAGAATTNTISGYTVDRFGVYQSTTGKLIAQQNAGSVTPPAGFTKYFGLTSQSAYTVGTSDAYQLYQFIEGYNIADLGFGTSNAKTVTLSFVVYSSLTGNFGGSLYTANASTQRSYPFTYTVPVANTWTQISITIPGDTFTNTWNTTNGQGLAVNFGLGSGSTYLTSTAGWQTGIFVQPTGTISLVGTNGATFYITGVQLEVGSSATGFDYRPYGTELALCQRYTYRISSANSSGNFTRYGVGGNHSTTSADAVISFPVTMRINPSLTVAAASQYGVYTAGTLIACTAVGIDASAANPHNVTIIQTVASGLTSGYASEFISNANQTSYILFSAEL